MIDKRTPEKQTDDDSDLYKKMSSMMTRERYSEAFPGDSWWLLKECTLTLHSRLSECGNRLYSLRVMQYDIEDKAADGTLDQQNAFHEHFFGVGALRELGVFDESTRSCMRVIDVSDEVWTKIDTEWPDIVRRTVTTLLSRQDNKYTSEDTMLEGLIHLTREYLYDVFLPRVLLRYLVCLIGDDEEWILLPKKIIFDVSTDSIDELLHHGTPTTIDEDTTPHRVSREGIRTLEALSRVPIESMRDSMIAIIPRIDRHQIRITYNDDLIAIELFEKVDGKNKSVGTASIPIKHGVIPFTLECTIQRKKMEYPLLIRF